MLLAVGIISALGDDNPTVSEALRASGALNQQTTVAPVEIPVPDDTVADLAADENPVPTTPATTTTAVSTTTVATTTTATIREPEWSEWPIVLSTTFSDDVLWDYGVAGLITRDFTGDSYTVSRSIDSVAMFVPTWQNGYQPSGDFRVAVDVVGSPGGAECGLAAGVEGLPALFFIVDSAAGTYDGAYFTSSNSAERVAEGSRRIAIYESDVNRLALLRQGDVITLYANDTPLAEITDLALDVDDLGLAMYVPADTDGALCEYDNFEIRWP